MFCEALYFPVAAWVPSRISSYVYGSVGNSNIVYIVFFLINLNKEDDKRQYDHNSSKYKHRSKMIQNLRENDCQ